MTQTNQNHFNVLDSWRGICACMVALSHMGLYNHVYNLPVFWNAGYYVDFFFVLSGFVIFANYQNRLRQGFGTSRFMLIRFGRIYPLHLLTLLMFIAHEMLQMLLPRAGSMSTFQPFSSPGEGGYEIVMNILLLHSFNLTDVYSFNSPSWSISAEFYTYLLFALLIGRFYGWRWLWMSLCMISGFIFFAFFDGKGGTHDWGIIRCIYGFAAGGLCWIMWNRWRERAAQLTSSVHAWTVLELLTVTLALYLIGMAGKTLLVGFTPLVFALLIFVFAFEKGLISRLLSYRFFVLIGALSYSIYMLHAFIAWKVINPMIDIYYHFSDVQITTVVDGQRKLGLTPWQGDLISCGYLAIVIAASYLSYRFFEMPCRNFFKRKADLWFRRDRTEI